MCFLLMKTRLALMFPAASMGILLSACSTPDPNGPSALERREIALGQRSENDERARARRAARSRDERTSLAPVEETFSHDGDRRISSGGAHMTISRP